MQPGRFTELFFLDEATALAAGHRPCALCRREDYVSFSEVWRRTHDEPVGADAIDAQLHGERVARLTRGRLLHRAQLEDLPDGTFVVESDAAWLVLGSKLLRWTSGSCASGKRTRGDLSSTPHPISSPKRRACST